MEYSVVNEVESQQIMTIRVSEADSYDNIVEKIEDYGDGRVRLYDSSSDRDLLVKGREHAEALIRGLKKSIELGWLY